MSDIWNAAKADTLKTCGPEVEYGDSVADVNAAFDAAKGKIKKQTGIFETESGRLDKNGAMIKEQLLKGGENACKAIVKALRDTNNQSGIRFPEQDAAKAAQNKAIETAILAQNKASDEAAAAGRAAALFGALRGK